MTGEAVGCGWDRPALEAYWLGELDASREEEVEEHLFACSGCTRWVAELAALQAGLAGLVETGQVLAATTSATLARAVARGMRLRTYRIAPGGTVHCTIAPEDDANVVRLSGPFSGVGRLDIRSEQLAGGALIGSSWSEDVPVDHASGEILLLNPGAAIRALTASTFRLEVVERTAAGEARPIARYTLEHSPWTS